MTTTSVVHTYIHTQKKGAMRYPYIVLAAIIFIVCTVKATLATLLTRRDTIIQGFDALVQEEYKNKVLSILPFLEDLSVGSHKKKTIVRYPAIHKHASFRPKTT